MKAEDLSADYSELTEWELKVLDDWLAYYTKVSRPLSFLYGLLLLFVCPLPTWPAFLCLD